MKYAITYLATNTIIVECDENGLDSNGDNVYPRPVDPNNITAIIRKVELENLPHLLCDWISNDDATISVQVTKIS